MNKEKQNLQKKCLTPDSSKLMVGARVRVARRIKRMRQEELAKKMGVGQSAVAKWESGEVSLEVPVAKKLAEVLGFDWQWFYKD